MKELTIEQKAKAYDEAAERALKLKVQNPFDTVGQMMEYVFPELAESGDEKIRKEILDYIDKATGCERWVAWLEKQGECETDCHRSHQDANHPNGCIVLEDFNGGEGFYKVQLDYLSRKQVEVVEEMVRTWNNDSKVPDEDIKSCIGMCLTDAHEQRFKDYNTSLKDCLAWLEMQGGQEEPQVYKAKDGEIITYSETDGYKVAEPKFKVGDWIVTPENKTLQITSIKGTCYSFNNESHYWEIYYCDKKCRLWDISDARDGDVLVDEDNNIGIYRRKVDDVDWHSCIYLGCDNHLHGFNIGGNHNINNTKPASKEQRGLLFQKMKESGYEWDAEELKLDKVEPKFKVGDWVVRGNTIAQILDIQEQYYVGLDINGKDFTSSRFLNADKIHLWNIEDAKDGDVLQLGGVTAIFKEYIGNGYCKCYCSVYDGEFGIPSQDGEDNIYGCTNATPATKEQRDLLFQKMKEADYEFDFDKKELKKIEDEEYDGEDYGIDGLWHAKNILEKTLGEVEGYQTDDGILDHKCAIAVVNKLYKQKPAEWSEEDEKMLVDCFNILHRSDYPTHKVAETVDWLKSLKQRIGG